MPGDSWNHRITPFHETPWLFHIYWRGNYTELDAWSGKLPRTRLTARESTRRLFVKSRQPFFVVESDDFQGMFLTHGN
jgi:hypothetical protein